MRTTRREYLALTGAAALTACAGVAPRTGRQLGEAVARIEAETGGSFGVALVDSGGLTLGEYRGDIRVAMASTFKASLGAMALAAEQAGTIDLSERTRWTSADLVFHRPFTEARLDSGASWRELAQAAHTLSDNTAANLLLRRLGGPEALTRFWRALGDDVSRLDRWETELNRVPPGDPRDTTTPIAMAHTVHRLLFGDRLSPDRRAILRQWFIDSATGLKRVRAGLPPEWSAGDKTGNSGAYDDAPYVRGDVGFFVGPGGGQFAFAVYHTTPIGATIAPARIDEGFAAIGAAMAGIARAG